MEVVHFNQRQLATRWAISEATLERWRCEGIGPKFLKLCGRVLSSPTPRPAPAPSCLGSSSIRQKAWDPELLKALHIPQGLLPAVHPSSHVYGHSDPALLGAAIPIAGIAGDQQSALFGQACFEAGLAKNTYGTGCFMLMHTGTECPVSQNGLITAAAAQTGTTPEFALEGSVFIGGAVVQWLRDGLRAIPSSGSVQALAESVPDAGGVIVVPAFTGLGAPYWQPDARGAIVGLSRGSTIAHIARAALESIAFQSAALLQAMSRDVMAGGGAPVHELPSMVALASTTC